MAYELRDGGGTIFKNKFKEDGDNKPDYKGEIMWRGEKIEIAHWVKQGQNGKFFSVKLQEPREQSSPPPAPQSRPAPATARETGLAQARADMDDEIPF